MDILGGQLFTTNRTEEQNEYYVNGTANYIQYLVNILVNYHVLDGKSISMHSRILSIGITGIKLNSGKSFPWGDYEVPRSPRPVSYIPLVNS